MIPKSQPERFQYVEKVFFRFVLVVTVLSALLCLLAYIASQVVFVVPAAITAVTGMLIYVHGANFLFGFLRVIKFLVSIMKLKRNVSIGRSLLAMVVSPVVGFAVYIAFFIMALTGCAA